MNLSRRAFLAGCLAAGGLRTGARRAGAGPAPLGFPAREWPRESSVGAALRAGTLELPSPSTLRPVPSPIDWPAVGVWLRARFGDLRRHFIFEYYPWYGADPYRHWDQWHRRPPLDLASNYVPRLGAYDSRAAAVLERHAAWIAESGAGAINVSWWGPGSYCDRAVPLLMDVMRAHDIHVTFHLEPYRDDRAAHYVRDVLYLLREYGEKRRWDCLLLLERADGTSGPVFKSFRTILPSIVTDCHGVARLVPDYTPDPDWQRETDALRDELRHDFDRLTLLADSLHVGRTLASGFDGIAVYDNFVEPFSWTNYAAAASASDLVFSFNANPGYDGIEPRVVEPGSCYQPTPFEPDADGLDWSTPDDRERAGGLSRQRIVESLAATLRLQTDDSLANARRGFFLVFLNSFNEWHEGHQFEPMKDGSALDADEQALGYHNPRAGDYRLQTLGTLLAQIMA